MNEKLQTNPKYNSEEYRMSLQSHSRLCLKGHTHQQRFMKTGRKQMSLSICKKGKKEDPWNYRLVRPTSIPGTVMEQLILEIICKHMKDKMIWSSQCGFMKGKACLANLVAFYSEMTGTVGKQRVVYHYFSKIYDTMFHCLSSS